MPILCFTNLGYNPIHLIITDLINATFVVQVLPVHFQNSPLYLLDWRRKYKRLFFKLTDID